jgi:hypothetical protein
VTTLRQFGRTGSTGFLSYHRFGLVATLRSMLKGAKQEGIGVASCVRLIKTSISPLLPLGTTLLSLLVASPRGLGLVATNPKGYSRGVQGVIALRRKLSWLPHIGSLPYGHEESDKPCRLLPPPDLRIITQDMVSRGGAILQKPPFEQ